MRSSPFFGVVALLAVPGLLPADGATSAASLAEEIVLTPPTGSDAQDEPIVHWQQRARNDNATGAVFEQLGWAYVARARRTLDAGYYLLAAKTADASEARFGSSAEAQLLRGHALHNLHRFREAERVARELAARRGAPEDFALLSDALMEQGQLDAAVKALQRAADLKPGVETYSRIAHLRWLKGDLPGAIAAMECALRAIASRDAEPRAWALARLSGYQLQAGHSDRALAAAEAAERAVANYSPALLARGRALFASGKIEDALDPLQRAASPHSPPEAQWWLADALRANGRNTEALAVEARLRVRGEAADARTLALFLATRREDADRAVRLARAELGHRADVFSHDALAWALAAAGDLPAAEAAMQRALSEHTQDARLLWHAGEIALAQGRRAEAGHHFAAAAPHASTLTPGERELLARRLSTRAAAPPATHFPASSNLLLHTHP